MSLKRLLKSVQLMLLLLYIYKYYRQKLIRSRFFYQTMTVGLTISAYRYNKENHLAISLFKANLVKTVCAFSIFLE